MQQDTVYVCVCVFSAYFWFKKIWERALWGGGERKKSELYRLKWHQLCGIFEGWDRVNSILYSQALNQFCRYSFNNWQCCCFPLPPDHLSHGVWYACTVRVDLKLATRERQHAAQVLPPFSQFASPKPACCDSVKPRTQTTHGARTRTATLYVRAKITTKTRTELCCSI